MNISIIGTGYVGLVTGACLSEFGMNVMCMDIDNDKIDKLRKGIVPIYEPDLSAIIIKNHSISLNFTSSIKEATDYSDVIFIAVNTPTLEDGTSDLSQVFQAASDIAYHMQEYKIIVNKSTVPVFTGQNVRSEIEKILKQQNKNINFDVVSNPEFLQEGSAVENFINPDRIVLGYETERALGIMKKVYNIQLLQGVPLVCTNLETAELIKYASNAFLATKISFINEMANLCEHCNADILTVTQAMGLDERIGPKFLRPGPGYGGSCFPKDTRALVGLCKKLKCTSRIVKSTIEVNELQKKKAFIKIKKHLKTLHSKVVTVLGLAFKPQTDDIRESPSIDIIKLLLENEAIVKVYDPVAMENAKTAYPRLDIEYCENAYSACMNSECIILATEWKEFKKLDFLKLRTLVQTPVFIDLRNEFDPQFIKNSGFIYEGVGRKLIPSLL